MVDLDLSEGGPSRLDVAVLVQGDRQFGHQPGHGLNHQLYHYPGLHPVHHRYHLGYELSSI